MVSATRGVGRTHIRQDVCMIVRITDGMARFGWGVDLPAHTQHPQSSKPLYVPAVPMMHGKTGMPHRTRKSYDDMVVHDITLR